MQITKDGEKKKVEVARWPFRFVKVLTNQWLNLLIVILWYIFSVSVQLIAFFASDLRCSVTAYPIATLQTIVIVFFIVFWTLGLVYDIANSFSELYYALKAEKAKNTEEKGEVNLCKTFVVFFWEQFSKRDPFYYRFELYFIGPVIIIFYLCISFAVLIAKVDSDRPVSIALSSTLFHFLLFYQVLFPLILTIIEIIRQCFNPKTKINEEIDVVLFDQKGHEIVIYII